MVEAEIPAVVIGRCVACKRPFRIEISRSVAERFGARFPNCIAHVLRAAGIPAPSCDCRKTTRCPETGTYGLPECLDYDCAGHEKTSVKFAAVKVAYKPEVTCGGSCWTAKSSKCTCSCRGKNHGGAHTIGRF